MVPLNILHVLRTPVGGLFRHVLDLARGQIARGHHVGIIADSGTGGPDADATLAALAPGLELGLSRTPMRRVPGPWDLPALLHVMRRIGQTRADVVHGHGAKGGAFVRLAPNTSRAIRAYTPHGGSLHYDPNDLAGRLFLGSEKMLMSRGDLYIFESAYSAGIFRKKIGAPKSLTRVVHNGVSEAEFTPVKPARDATDLLFVGELRLLKGVDVLIASIAQLRNRGRTVSATIVGAGSDRPRFEADAARYEVSDLVRFAGAMPARQAFALGRVLVVPSRAESLPYIVLEAAAAGKPQIATSVGGIPELFGSQSSRLVPPDDAGALGRAIAQTLDHPADTEQSSVSLRERVANSFTIDSMVDGVLAGYAEALAAKGRPAAEFNQFAALR
jgi:glycosyltransferase involved in cell wall biosynthesis